MLAESVLNALRAAVGLDGVSVGEAERTFYSGDLWPRLLIRRLAREAPATLPDAVAWPRDAEAVRRVVAICREAGVPVIPYGAGSGVCGGTVPVQGGVVLDLKRMNRLLEVDDLSMTAVVEAGMIGRHLENALNERGYTLGHFPSSIMCSTVGGWVATRSAGQFSSRYGKIEDMVLALDVVLPDGTEVVLDATRTHRGQPDFTRLMIGSEGTLGVITRVHLKIHPSPSTRRFAGFRFMDVVAALEAMRSIMQHGLRPAVMRLYDPLDTLINRFSMSSDPDAAGSRPHDRDPRAGREGEAGRSWEGGRRKPIVGGWGKPLRAILGRTLDTDLSDLASLLTGPMLRSFLSHPALFQRAITRLPLSSLLVVGFEGDDRRTRENLDQATDLARRATGRDLGPGPGEHWYRHRYSVSFKLSPVFGQGAFVETIEVAGLWRDIPRIYSEVRSAVIGRAAILAHFSHAYREGCAVYFTLAGYRADPAGLGELYDQVVRRALAAAMRAGATVSHHHGIGLMKRAFIPEEYEGGDHLFWALKEALDPSGIMNPEKVYPPTVPVERPKTEQSPERSEFEAMASWEHWTRRGRVVVPEVPEEIGEVLDLARSTGLSVVCQQARRPGEERVLAGGGRAGAGDRGPTETSLESFTVLDLSRLDEVLDMDPVSGTVTAQAGITVHQLENYLHEKGFTLGFVPRSRLLLSLGDYLATSCPSEGSPLYGTILDNCLGLSGVMADRTPFRVRPSPRRAVGPDLMHLLLGAGGRYGVITAACLRVFPLPAVREAVAFATDDAVVALSAVRTTLVRQARPEWVLIVVRAPTHLDSRRRVRIVYQFGGNRASVTTHLSVVRSVMESLGMESEAVRTEERMVPQSSRARAVERFLPMKAVMESLADLSGVAAETCPEVHVTDIAPHGATLRLLIRDEAHVFPVAIAKRLSAPKPPEVLVAVADRLKQALDPDGTLNPHVTGDGR